MKSVIAASVLALMASTSAFATDVDADISQFAMGIQNALNEIEDVKTATDVTQEAVNAANLVSKVDASNLTEVYQKSMVKQGAVNSIEPPKFNKVDVVGAVQEATNVANSISLGKDDGTGAADALEKIRQFSFGDQSAMNKIYDADLADTVAQTAVNAANLVTLSVDAGAIDKIMQKSTGDQDATNEIDTGWNWGYYGPYRNGAVITDVTQSATNVANSISLGTIGDTGEMLDEVSQDAFVDQSAVNDIKVALTAEDVAQEAVNATNLITSDLADLGDVSQMAWGSQEALNTIEFKDWIDGNAMLGDAVVPSSQSATNVINSVSAPEIRTTLAQFSHVNQKASNVADSVSSSSKVWDLNQTAVNAANLVSIGTIGGDLELDQLAFVSQNASNLIDANGTVEAVVQSATNVANSIGDLN
jgi:hypothetical protein